MNNEIIKFHGKKTFVYTPKHKFKELNETNIPVSILDKIPKDIKQILIIIDNKSYLINEKELVLKPRKVGKHKVIPIPLNNKEPIKFTLKKKNKKSKFVHLHLHSDMSLMDGVTKCGDYLERAKKFGMESMAITEHGNVSSHMDLQLRASKFGIKPIFGVEMYFVNDASLHDGDHKKSQHVVLLAKDKIGYRNLLRLQKLSWSDENYYYRPRIDKVSLKKHRKGLILLTACLKGIVSNDLFSKGRKRATKRASWLKKLFGDDLYLELQLHNIYNDDDLKKEHDIQAELNKELIKISKKLDIKTVITNDVHYLDKGMHEIQNKIIRMRSESDLARTYCDSIWFKSYKEIKETWKDDCDYISKRVFNESVNNTLEISDKCNYVIPTGGLRIPEIDISTFPKYKEGQNKEEYIRARIKSSLKKKKNDLAKDKSDYLERIEIEIDAFAKMDVMAYILIFDDLIRHLKTKGCLCSLRGSANGSVILWLLGLSIVDPLKYDILFERFISPARIEAKMADIDIDLDISHTFRETAINYLKEKYGDDKICIVGSFGRNQLKASIKNVARVEALELKSKIENTTNEKKIKKLQKKLSKYSFQEMNRITKLMPEKIEDIDDPEALKWIDENSKLFENFIKPIVGNAYSMSLHPAGIIVSPDKFHNWLPVRTNKLSKEKGGGRVFASQWENSHTGEEFLNERGVMIMDILGVKTLTVINDTLELIKKRHGKKLKLEDIPIDDKKVYSSLSKGENLGIFQLGKESLRGMFRSISPDNLDELNFFIAADRPGPMASGVFESYVDRKNGEEEIEYPHPSLKHVLNDTKGIFVYSEHIMNTGTFFAGMDPIDSEKFRKIIKSKRPEELNEFKDKFINGAIKKWTIKKSKK